MKHLGIEMIPAYSPEARGSPDRIGIRTRQDRLPREPAFYPDEIGMEAANRHLAGVYQPAFNAGFVQPPMEEGTAFVKWLGTNIDDILCEQYERVVTADNPDVIGTLKAKRYNFPQIDIAAIMSGSRSESIVILMAL